MQHDDIMLPTPLPVPQVEGLPSNVGQAYDEARKSFAVQAYTGCELLCRKILMNVAVDKGAKEGKSFAYYVDYLEKHGYITPPLKDMASTIKDNGNESTHKIGQPDPARAEYTLEFTSQILRTVYEVEAKFSKYQSSQASP